MNGRPGPRSTLRHYRPRELRHDVPAGLALTAVLLPQGMAYARLAGLPAVTGLYTTIACLAAYAALGPSRRMMVGPDSSVSPLVFAALSPLAGSQDPETAVALAGMLGLLVGGIELLLGLAGLGFVANLLSKPVRIGFLNGLAVVIIVSQLPALCGFSSDGHDPVAEASDWVLGLGETSPWALALGLGTLAIILVTRWRWRRVPGVLLAVVTATVVSLLVDAQSRGVPVLGTLPRGLPGITIPWTSVDDLAALLVAALGIVLISLADTIAVSSSLAAKEGQSVDPNREIVAIGGANIATSLFQGFAISASASRTAVVEDAGGRSQMSGLVGAAGVAGLLVLAPGLLADLPLSSLAAVVIVAASRLVDVATLRRVWRARPTSVVVALAATGGVVLLGVLPGVAFAVTLSVAFFLQRNWWPADAVLGRVPGLRGWHSLARYPEARSLPGILVFRWDAPLFFANATVFQNRVRDVLNETRPTPHHVVLECAAITDIDITAAEMLSDVDRELDARGVTLVFADLRDRLQELLAGYRVEARLDEKPFYRSVKEALEAITGEHLDDMGLG